MISLDYGYGQNCFCLAKTCCILVAFCSYQPRGRSWCGGSLRLGCLNLAQPTFSPTPGADPILGNVGYALKATAELGGAPLLLMLKQFLCVGPTNMQLRSRVYSAVPPLCSPMPLHRYFDWALRLLSSLSAV